MNECSSSLVQTDIFVKSSFLQNVHIQSKGRKLYTLCLSYFDLSVFWQHMDEPQVFHSFRRFISFNGSFTLPEVDLGTDSDSDSCPTQK